jgi:hypothetical protein
MHIYACVSKKQLLRFIRISKWEQHPNLNPTLIKKIKCIYTPALFKTALVVYTDFKTGATPTLNSEVDQG